MGHSARLAELRAYREASTDDPPGSILEEIDRIEAYATMDQVSYDALVRRQIKRLRRMTSGHPGADDSALDDITSLGEPDGNDADADDAASDADAANDAG